MRLALAFLTSSLRRVRLGSLWIKALLASVSVSWPLAIGWSSWVNV